jgi:hypothetical protein
VVSSSSSRACEYTRAIDPTVWSSQARSKNVHIFSKNHRNKYSAELPRADRVPKIEPNQIILSMRKARGGEDPAQPRKKITAGKLLDRRLHGTFL